MCEERSTLSGVATKIASGCPAYDSEKVADRGRYSFVAGDQRDTCHACPAGVFCHGGDTMEVEYGWWLSGGLTSHKSKIYVEHNKKGLPPLNNFSSECGWLLEWRGNATKTASTYHVGMAHFQTLMASG